MSDTAAANKGPENTTSYRLARAAVIILGALIVIAIVLLVVGLVWRMTGHAPAAPPGPATSHVTLARGARIVSIDSQPGRIVLHVRSSEGDEVDIVDTEDGHLVAQVKAPAK